MIVSPLAELGAALHRLTAIDHGTSDWTAKTWVSMPASLRDECRLFSAIWGGYRSRFLLPTTHVTNDFAHELARVAAMPLNTFTTLAAYALAGSDHRLGDNLSPGRLRKRARGRGCALTADLLITDATMFRSRLIGVLQDCWTTFFAADWQQLGSDSRSSPPELGTCWTGRIRYRRCAGYSRQDQAATASSTSG